MPINSLNTGAQNPVNLFDSIQNNTQFPKPRQDGVPATSGPEENFTVDISDRAQKLSEQNAQNRADFEEDIEQEEEIQQAASEKILSRTNEAGNENQSSVDLFA